MARPKLLNEDFKEYLLTNSVHGMIDMSDLGDSFNVSRDTVYREAKKLGVVHAPNHLLEITTKYVSGSTVRSLSKEYSVSQVTINAFFRRHAIKQRYAQYTFNHSYFESIDSEDKAYFLGFILADGCIYRNSLLIRLSSVDHHILEDFRYKVGGNFKIWRKVLTTTYGTGEFSGIIVTSDKLVSDLAKLGVVPRKTDTATFPEVRADLRRHMVRGYLDGDGFFTKYLNKGVHTKFSMGFCGSPESLEYLRIHLKEVHPSTGSISKRHKGSSSRVLSLTYSGGGTIKAYLDHLYAGSTIHLERKFRKYQDFYVTYWNKKTCSDKISSQLT